MSTVADLYELLLFGHILGAMVWVGAAVLLAALAARILRARDAAEATRFLSVLRVIGPRLLAPATITVVVLGAWMVLDNAAWGFDQLWIEVALGLFAIAFVIGPAVVGRAAIEAGRADERGESDEVLRQFARWCWGYGLIVVLLIAATWDMVEKPL